jgi:hypothetical protein
MRIRASLPIAVAVFAMAPAAFAADPLTVGEYGSFSVDATVLHEATPDVINQNVTCDVQNPLSRAEVREEAQRKMQQIVGIVGDDGQVRRNGSPSVYPFYEGPVEPRIDGEAAIAPSPRFTGSISMVVRNVKKDAAQSINDRIEDLGCSVNWDIRLLRTAAYARQHRAQLMEQIDEKKAVFEELLGKKLTKVSSMSLYTSVDYGYGGYGSFDPQTLTVPATTTLNMTFEFGTGEKDEAGPRG